MRVTLQGEGGRGWPPNLEVTTVSDESGRARDEPTAAWAELYYLLRSGAPRRVRRPPSLVLS